MSLRPLIGVLLPSLPQVTDNIAHVIANRTEGNFKFKILDYIDLPRKPSALSPLNPSSPLYPDGLIHPDWIKKHTDIVPSALVSFNRLTNDMNLLCTTINNAKKQVAEKSIKIAVVLILDGVNLDSNIDEKLNFIRKSCQIEKVFVLPPGVGRDGPGTEVYDFFNL